MSSPIAISHRPSSNIRRDLEPSVLHPKNKSVARIEMEPILVSPLVYVLELEGGNYYIGATHNFNMRIAQHISGNGAKWTRLHKPKSVVEIILDISKTTENATTLRYIDLYGPERVRGGSWCGTQRINPVSR